MLVIPWYAHIEWAQHYWRCGGDNVQSRREMSHIAGALLYDDGKNGGDDDDTYTLYVELWLDEMWTVSFIISIAVVIVAVWQYTFGDLLCSCEYRKRKLSNEKSRRY